MTPKHFVPIPNPPYQLTETEGRYIKKTCVLTGTPQDKQRIYRDLRALESALINAKPIK